MEFSTNLKRYLISIFSASTLVFSAHSFAGAFQLWEESAASMGDYHAGAAAEANNASTVFYNPAGMSRIKHQQISLGAAFIDLGVNYTGNVTSDVSSTTYTPPGGVPGDTFNVVPNLHYVLPISNKWAFGLEETTPFGLSTKYADINNVGLLATKTELETINLNPNVSYVFNKYFSVGVGFDVLRGQAVYDDTFLYVPMKNRLEGWGYGYNAGVLFQLSKRTRFGLSYRSPITIKALGASESVVSSVTNKSTVSAVFPLPATTMLSMYHDMNNHLALMASAFYTQWSCFRQLVIKNLMQPIGGTATVAINENYRDTWNFSVGTRYKFNQYVALEAGFGHDETPTRIPYRDIRLPDGNRYVGSLGVNIYPNTDCEWSLGWTHLFTGSTPVDNSGSNDASQTTTISAPAVGIGSVHSNVNVFGVQFTVNI